MSDNDQKFHELFKIQFEMIDRLKGETAALQLLLKGMVAEIAQWIMARNLLPIHSRAKRLFRLQANLVQTLLLQHEPLAS